MGFAVRINSVLNTGSLSYSLAEGEARYFLYTKMPLLWNLYVRLIGNQAVGCETFGAG